MGVTQLNLVLLLMAGLSVPAFSLKLTSLVKGLRHPVYVTTAPGEANKLYIVEQDGKVLTFEKGKLSSTPFLDIQKKVVTNYEMGLFCIAFHPKYPSNGRYFVKYTAQIPNQNVKTIVAEYQRGEKEEKRLLEVDQLSTNHSGGQLAFDKQGLLYIGTGDGGSQGDPENRGQNLKSLSSKMLRLDVDKKGKAAPEIFAWGLRNPWRFSFDRETGVLVAGDVGQDVWEEINIIEQGKNYGWSLKEGKHCYRPAKDCDPKGETIDPIFEYPHSEGISITGGYVYRGKAIPSLNGVYIYGDFNSGKIWGLTYDFSGKQVIKNELLLKTGLPISSFGEDEAGEILVVSHAGGVFRLVP